MAHPVLSQPGRNPIPLVRVSFAATQNLELCGINNQVDRTVVDPEREPELFDNSVTIAPWNGVLNVQRFNVDRGPVESG